MASVKVPVFIKTTLETNILMPVSPDASVKDLKREFISEHLKCFPSVGKIRITGLMVKRKSFFYHLPDSLPIKNAFQRWKGAWFLLIEANLVSNSSYPCAGEFGDISNEDSGVTPRRHCCNIGNKIDSNPREEGISLPAVETPISVNGIITRYFPEYEEAKSPDVGSVSKNDVEAHPGCPVDLEKFPRSKNNVDQRPPHIMKTPSSLLPGPVCTKPKQETSRGKFGRTEVGKRLAVAANSIRVSTGTKTSVSSACLSTVDKFPTSLIRKIVFEVSDNDD
ncbi:hypothetical protein C5167_047269 [Papaver somniferum]|uniref:Uncharacterized protein n=2 Tax=Papaver somniferum TaxID=3469 RepID=A0A4Y7LG57_PAPSO|nr:uncharacterized protein LOC113323283 isoform X1 [Papaver somniferum]RZC84483.1 hypothetical protein C5167_047269 [Papaver somniferum]